MNVYDVLFPANSKYSGWTQFAVITRDKKMFSLGCSDFGKVRDRAEEIKIKKSNNYYIMANTIKKFTKRQSENLFSLNNIVLDYDIHGRMEVYDREELIEDFIWRLKRDLFDSGELIAPNVIHRTGRGVQLWFHIESAAAKLLFLYQDAIDYIDVIIRKWLDDHPTLKKSIDIDIVASKNAVGLFRMFDTYNTKAKKMTDTEILHDKSITLNELVSKLKENEYVKEYIKRKEAAKKRNKKEKYNDDDEEDPRFIPGRYTALNYKRIKIIEQIATETEDCEGHRNNMIFLAFNAARQIYSTRTAKKICIEINNSFSKPLKKLDHIFKEEKIYHFKNLTFFEKLGISQDELQITGKYALSKPNITRDLQRAERKEEKEAVKEYAKKLLKDGERQKVVVEKTGLSLSTVARLSAKMKKE